LILDEATASIDPECEKIIHDAIFTQMKNLTILIIAHRLDTLKQCDRILTLESGKLLEQKATNFNFNQDLFDSKNLA
jgi:ATP-binding cassette subfamily B protein